MPSGKWVKIRVKFGMSCVWEACLNKISKFLRFCDGIFRKQSLLSRKCLKIWVCGLFSLVHKTLLNIPMYFLPRKYAPVSQTFVYKRTVLKKIWEISKIAKFLLFRKKSKTGEWLRSYFNYPIYDIYCLNREFLRTNWCIFQSAAPCLKTVPPLSVLGVFMGIYLGAGFMENKVCFSWETLVLDWYITGHE